MNTRSWIFKHLLCSIAVLLFVPQALAIDLRPRHISCQTGGGMGAVSLGTGWKYGRHQRWETDLFIGLVPKYDSSSAKVSFALKENFVPWQIRLNNKITLEPLTSSVYFTTLISDKVWRHLPERYSHGYYILPTKIRANISLGQRMQWMLSQKSSVVESISTYYELGTCDIYVLSAAGNSKIKLHELMQLCIGIRINFNR